MVTEMTLDDLIGSGADRTFPTGLSHVELLAVTGLNNARLMGWYKRRKLPNERVQAAPGRGNRRRYEVSLALFFLMRRVAADAGLSLEDSEAVGVDLANMVAFRAGADFDKSLLQAQAEIASEDPERRIPGMAVIVPHFDGAPPRAGQSEPFWREPLGASGVPGRFVAIALERNLTELKLSHWMRKNAIPHAVLIDYWSAAVQFAAGLASVLAARKPRVR